MEWGKAFACLPKNNLKSHKKIDDPKFYASYEFDLMAWGFGSSPNMYCLLQHAYGNIWLREHNAFIIRGAKRKPIPIVNSGISKKPGKMLKLKKETERKTKVEQDSRRDHVNQNHLNQDHQNKGHLNKDHQSSPKLKKV